MDEDMKVPPEENFKLSEVLSFKLGVGQNILVTACHPPARKSAFLISLFPGPWCVQLHFS